MRFDRVAILDWSAAGSPTKGKDSIWIGVTGPDGTTAQNLPTRGLAEEALAALIDDCLTRGQRLLLGADFNFGAPTGLAARLTGRSEALSWWHWLAERITDTERNQTNYRQIAAEMNLRFAGEGPFWGNGAKQQVDGLPRTKPALPDGLAEHRQTDLIGRTGGLFPKTIWQLAGAGAVGAQSLTGIPVFWRLRQRFRPHCGVWPFDDAQTAITFAEIYASHVTPQVSQLESRGMVRDEAQVRLLSSSFYKLDQKGRLPALFAKPDDCAWLNDEGWTLGNGYVQSIQMAAETR
ncbi:hypothetical protein [Flavimaricola marinus]|uniref:Cobalamin biosynthesis protein CbiG n=1 Tax=Flavimaricola marinus TaxID=1819565 RepID=A0A238LBB6_9RHOB|nr:hypothetical protein [Flavimaricola marinus]SMY06901.1 hypothetical protein LOM8899_01031 [Flavimaricola marinus]